MDSLFSLHGKVALVTGGAQGLGRMIAEGLAGAGADVYITSRKADVCKAAAREIGPSVHPLPGDAGTPEGILDITRRLRESGIRELDILVNNAGRTWGAPIESFPDKAWTDVLAVNLHAPFNLIKELLPELQAAGSAENPARVINIGSIAGITANDLKAYSYSASKAALHQLSRQLAHDLAARNINVNCVVPGYFPTSMTAHMRDKPEKSLEKHIPRGRLGTPEDIAGAVVFLSSRAGAYITGADLPVDGGVAGCR